MPVMSDLLQGSGRACVVGRGCRLAAGCALPFQKSYHLGMFFAIWNLEGAVAGILCAMVLGLIPFPF